jgi:2-polyprenyl-6-methoxyphenol hydroxylase-like FAD-dependent oxidoreductase
MPGKKKPLIAGTGLGGLTAALRFSRRTLPLFVVDEVFFAVADLYNALF